MDYFDERRAELGWDVLLSDNTESDDKNDLTAQIQNNIVGSPQEIFQDKRNEQAHPSNSSTFPQNQHFPDQESIAYNPLSAPQLPLQPSMTFSMNSPSSNFNQINQVYQIPQIQSQISPPQQQNPLYRNNQTIDGQLQLQHQHPSNPLQGNQNTLGMPIPPNSAGANIGYQDQVLHQQPSANLGTPYPQNQNQFTQQQFRQNGQFNQSHAQINYQGANYGRNQNQPGPPPFSQQQTNQNSGNYYNQGNFKGQHPSQQLTINPQFQQMHQQVYYPPSQDQINFPNKNQMIYGQHNLGYKPGQEADNFGYKPDLQGMLNSNQTLLPHMMQNHNMVLNINLQTPKIPNILEAEEESVLKLKCDARALKNPEKMAKFLSLPTEVLQNVVFQLANNNKLALVCHNIRVREIWVGSLPQDINEKTLKKAFSVYGEVDHFEIFQKPNLTFAFLRYKRSKEALMAFESVDHLSIVLKSTLRIAFSDYQKRAGIVGDCVTVTDDDEDFLPYLFIAYNSNTQLPKEKLLRSRLEPYCQIQNILMRPSYNTNLKSFMIIETADIEQCKKVRQHFFIDDKDGSRRMKLGDKKLEISILTKSKTMRIFEAVPQNNIGNPQGKIQIDVVPNFPASAFLNSLTPVLMNQKVKEQLIEIFGEQEQPVEKNLNEMDEEFPVHQPDGSKSPVYSKESIDHDANKLNEESTKNLEQEEEEEEDEDEPREPNEGEVLEVEEGKKKKWPVVQEILELFWSGFITKSKKTQVGVDAYLQSGEAELLEQSLFNLNISHKTTFDEVLSKSPIAVIIFLPSNQTMKNRFMEYYNYLSQKKIAGIVNHLKERLVYIVPSCPEMLKVAPLSSPNQLIGIITAFDKKSQGVDQKTQQNEAQSQETSQDGNMEELEDDGEVKKKVIPKFDPRFGDTANSSDTNSDYSKADETDETGSIASASDSRS